MAKHGPQFFLAKIYSEGYYGITPDLSRAVDLYKLAATQGLYRAQNNLAAFYENGIVVAKDTAKARELYKVAVKEPANNGVPEENLGHLELEEGNRQEAIHWFKLAADKGNTCVNPTFGIWRGLRSGLDFGGMCIS